MCVCPPVLLPEDCLLFSPNSLIAIQVPLIGEEIVADEG